MIKVISFKGLSQGKTTDFQAVIAERGRTSHVYCDDRTKPDIGASGHLFIRPSERYGHVPVHDLSVEHIGAALKGS